MITYISFTIISVELFHLPTLMHNSLFIFVHLSKPRGNSTLIQDILNFRLQKGSWLRNIKLNWCERSLKHYQGYKICKYVIDGTCSMHRQNRRVCKFWAGKHEKKTPPGTPKWKHSMIQKSTVNTQDSRAWNGFSWLMTMTILRSGKGKGFPQKTRWPKGFRVV